MRAATGHGGDSTLLAQQGERPFGLGVFDDFGGHVGSPCVSACRGIVFSSL